MKCGNRITVYTIKARAIFTSDVANKNMSQMINQNSGNVEYYTPKFIIEAAREVMGSIDLDPASCKEANQIVKADNFFTKQDNGLDMNWYGNVWMNHPFSKDNKLWIDKLICEFNQGKVNQAMCITYASTSERWFRPLYQFPICFLYPRTNYLLPGGKVKQGVTKGSCVIYLGSRLTIFGHVFDKLGSVMYSERFK